MLGGETLSMFLLRFEFRKEGVILADWFSDPMQLMVEHIRSLMS